MTVWQLTTGLSDRVATLVIPETDRSPGATKRFGGDGSTLTWGEPPRLEADNDGRKKPRPLGDLGPFLPGALLPGEKAHAGWSRFSPDSGNC